MVDIYNRHRPRTFADMYPTSELVSVGDKLITNTLDNKTPDLPHFMIFHSECGGLGKTTSGRILAVALNPDMSERDKNLIFNGAKNFYFFEINGGNLRKIDDARALEKEIEYKRNALFDHKMVYMVNEAHKLTVDAQDVFLQATENIPENIYIFFTATDIGKFNEKLLTRAQKYVFHSIDKHSLSKLLVDISTKETGNGLQEHIIDQIYEIHGNSIRSSINCLGEYLITGQVVPGLDREEEEEKYFDDIITILEAVALNKQKSWTKNMVPLLGSIMNQFSSDEIRTKLMKKFAGVLMNRGGIRGEGPEKQTQLERKTELYRRIAERVRHPVGYPPKSDMIMNFFLMYMDAKEIAGQK